jgi:hypothetical protein
MTTSYMPGSGRQFVCVSVSSASLICIGYNSVSIGCVPWITSSRNKETIQSRHWWITILDLAGKQGGEGKRGPVSPPHPHIHKMESVTIDVKATLHRSPSFSMIY